MATLVSATLVFLVLIDRLRVLWQFNFRYTDEDQTVLWYVARDVAAGHIREPCFPGQAYGTPVEAWLAAPLLWVHLPLQIALPLVSSALTVSAFFVWAWLARQRPVFAGLILCIPLVVPTEYGVLTSMPRGFAPMLWAATLGFAGLQSSRRPLLLLGGLFEELAYCFNESGLLLIVPCLAYWLATRRGRLRTVPWAAAGFLLGGLLHWLSRAFYRTHPAYGFHPTAKLQFEWPRVKDGLEHATRYFDAVSPAGSRYVLVAVVVALLALLVWTRSFVAAAIVIGWTALSVVSLGIPKVHDGEDSVFFSLARSYLTVPLGLAFVLYMLASPKGDPVSGERNGGWVALAVGGVAFVIQMVVMDSHLAQILSVRAWNVTPRPVSEVLKTCDAVSDAAAKTNTPLMTFDGDREFAYACGALHYGELTTLFPSYDRRTWLLQQEQHMKRDRMLVWTAGHVSCRQFRPGTQCQPAGSGLLLITFPPSPSLTVMRASGLRVRML